jgi:thiamine biosynthesis protein ThiS
MEIYVNGEPRDIPAHSTVAQLIETLQLTSRRTAVEINREIVPRGDYSQRQLQPGDRVEIVHAIGGG